MSRTSIFRLCRGPPRLFIRHGEWPSPAMGALWVAASQAAKRGLANNESGSHGPGPGEPEPEDTAEDDAARRRAKLLERYGDRSASSGPKPVKRDSSVGDPAAEDAEKTAADEADHDEIWGDYVSYMEHQRKKGWKT